jgi:hypothetical protein
LIDLKLNEVEHYDIGQMNILSDKTKSTLQMKKR